jgi:hypothetical protein
MLSFQIPGSSVEFLRLSRAYGAFCGDDPVLAPYPTLASLLDELDAPSAADRPARSRLLCAIIARQRSVPGPIGSAIVLHAFHGMLGKLAGELVGVYRDDADAVVACGLIEALRRVRPERDPERIAMYVRQETRRAVFAALARETPAGPDELDEEDDDVVYVAGSSSEGRAGLDLGEPTDDEMRDEAAGPRRGRRPEPDMCADPASLVPIEERLDVRAGGARRVSDAELLRAVAVRGGLRRLARFLFPDATARTQEHEYRQLLTRAKLLGARRE